MNGPVWFRVLGQAGVASATLRSEFLRLPHGASTADCTFTGALARNAGAACITSEHCVPSWLFRRATDGTIPRSSPPSPRQQACGGTACVARPSPPTAASTSQGCKEGARAVFRIVWHQRGHCQTTIRGSTSSESGLPRPHDRRRLMVRNAAFRRPPISGDRIRCPRRDGGPSGWGWGPEPCETPCAFQIFSFEKPY